MKTNEDKIHILNRMILMPPISATNVDLAGPLLLDAGAFKTAFDY